MEPRFMDDHQLKVTGRNGLRGTIASPPPTDPNARVEIRLDDGHRVTVPANLLTRSKTGSAFELPLGLEDLRTNGTEKHVIPIVREEMDVQKRTEERDRVVVHVIPKLRTEVVDIPVVQEQVEVQRTPVNRFVNAIDSVRQDGDVTIVPVYEEVLVVERRLMLKEEVRITRHRETKAIRREVELRTEEVHVMRSAGDRPGA